MFKMYINCPFKYKYQLVDFFATRYNAKKSKYNKMPKKQLYAMWYSIAQRSTMYAKRDSISPKP